MRTWSRAGGFVLSAFLFVVACAFALPTRAQRPEPLDMALVLALDASSSITMQRWHLQLAGYRDAFRSEDVLNAIKRGRNGAILVTVVQWSGAFSQRQMIEWVLVCDRQSANLLADRIHNMSRLLDGNTSITGAIAFSTGLLRVARFANVRKVIDISGDGANNDMTDPRLARDEAVKQGIVINGLPILGSENGIAEYYENYVIGGVGSFIRIAESFDDFAVAIKEKLVREISVSALPP